MSDSKQTKFSLDVKKYFYKFLKWLAIAIVTGIVCGAIGAAFAKSIALVTSVRISNSKLIFFLPIAALLIPFLYRTCKVTDIGVSGIYEAARSTKKVSFGLFPAIFISSVVTHLFGGSAGKEGAALQIGGSIASVFAKVLKFAENTRRIIVMSGMAGVFSAVFGTPLCAAVFAVEAVGLSSFTTAIFPCIITSATAFAVSFLCGVHAERFEIGGIPEISWLSVATVVLIAVAGFVASVLFEKSIYFSTKAFKKCFKNEYLRVFVGGAIIVLLTVALKTNDYNGAGLNIIEGVFENGFVHNEAFLLKIIFTAITLGAGLKGGEIVPTLFVGATLGAALAGFVGVNTSFCAAVGMTALFCGVTNCPLATVLLAFELFGIKGLLYFAVAVIFVTVCERAQKPVKNLIFKDSK